MSKPKIVLKYCKVHKQTEFVLEARGYYRCKKCRTQSVSKKRIKLKENLIEYKGGCCSVCGYNKCNAALEFHHTNPKEKDFALGNKGLTRSLSSLKREADKCILVCANCHREIHNC